MKRLSIIFGLSLILGLLADPAFPGPFQFDFDGDEVWDNAWILRPPPPVGETVELDIWLDSYTCLPDNKLFSVALYFK